jgi:hypothetical protein
MHFDRHQKIIRFAGGTNMKQYEYKFIRSKMKISFDYDKKITETEAEWNKLGAEGWKFCSWANEAVIFIRETDA